MIIFDWDDTILPSSFVDKAQADNLADLPQQYHNIFREIEACSEKCLAAAAKHGEVILITNSDEGWVKYSAERYLPGLLPVLKNYRIISARTRYEKFYPNQPLCWKAAAFAHEVNEHFCHLEEAHELLDRECSHGMSDDHAPPGRSMRGGGRFDNESLPDMDLASTDDSSLEDNSISSAEAESPGGGCRFDAAKFPGGAASMAADAVSSTPHTTSIAREIISFGDSIEERTAVKIVSDQLDALPKSVKFLNNPTPCQIVGQLTMLTHHMKFVCENEEELDLEISSKQAEKCAQGYLARRGMSVPEGLKKSSDSPTILQRILGTGNPPANEDSEMENYDC